MLGITVKTAETYRTRAMRKLGAHSVAGLVLEAVRLGLVDMDAFQSGFARALVDWGPDREVSQPRGEFHQSNRRGTAPRMNADVLWSRTQGITRQEGLCRTEMEGSPWPSPNRSRRGRWGTPTLFLQWPLWYDASQHEWSCTRGATATLLVDPEICRTCPYWSAAERHVRPTPPAHGLDACLHRRALVRRPDSSEAAGTL